MVKEIQLNKIKTNTVLTHVVTGIPLGMEVRLRGVRYTTRSGQLVFAPFHSTISYCGNQATVQITFMNDFDHIGDLELILEYNCMLLL